MKKLLAGLAAAFLTIGNASAALLVSFDSLTGISSSGGSNDGGAFFDTGVTQGNAFDNVNNGSLPKLFGDTLITSDTVLTSTSGAGFDYFADLVTNGVDDVNYNALWRNVGGSPVLASVGSGNESFVYGSASSASLNGIDLQGYVITSIVLTITNFSAPVNANGYSINFDYKLEVFGELAEVPLPAAAPLMLMGLGGIAALRRRRSKTA
ncbi:VPLPA-CTERM sorting domain-containing protein [Hyphococcus flavus]|uniref:VPLPA-CTERM sorting domain-containing protein n=1 Tax=Hyphococcus flavus TaxID=1866326 RepID=A0AAE9ZEG4_9PROT|nr:VPLPA-CTERM sorting domain-containing protein [Hyphococcus flavus]WDI31278.1 VPLPA-CTERM sorting domain-containing protein [Hyphococcus flavus]